MKYFSCENPQVVYNRSLGRYVNVRCGRCNACLNARAANWVQRLDQEMYYSPYTYFVTFQYDEQNVYQYIRLRKEDNPNILPSYIDSETGQIISLADVSLPISQKEIDYCFNTKVLLVPHYRDFQLFMKSLRKDLFKNYNNAKIRYYCTFEVGPTTYRPHAHCLFFFDSPLLSEDFGRLCCLHWKYGNTFDPHIVHGSASQYVASYVNCFANLPAIYLHSQIKPKSLFSKQPPIGYRAYQDESRKELFFKQKTEFTIYKPMSSNFCDVPLWRTFRAHLYPLISQFGALSHLDRIELYRLGRLVSEPEGEDIICRELYRLGYDRYFFTTVNGTPYRRYNENSYRRFKRVVFQAYKNALSFGISIEYFVTLLEDYYDSSISKQLHDYLLAQDLYFQEHPVCDYLLLDRHFTLNVNTKMYDDLDDWQKFYLDLYIPDLDKTKPIFLDGRTTFAYRELNKLHDKIAHDNTKTKEATDYLMANASKFQNVINYKF